MDTSWEKQYTDAFNYSKHLFKQLKERNNSFSSETINHPSAKFLCLE